MSLIKWTPFFTDNFGADDMNKMFSDMLPAVRENQFGFTPAVDVYEDQNNITIETQLAGIDPEEVDVSIENNVLIIKGKSEKKREIDEKNYYRKEISRGYFYRSIPMPTRVNGEAAKATSEGGILKIVVPKAAEVKTKTIKIETNKK